MTIPGRQVTKTRVPINGADQGILLEPAAQDSPVLLFLHGGPGMPEHWLNRRYPTRMHEAFTVAWWEQRGAGLSYRPGIPAAAVTVEQHIVDTIEVARYLCRRFGVEKVFLMGHSWGSFVGIKAAARAPELFHSYIGMSQVTHQIASEREAYQFVLDEYRRRGDGRMVRRLERAPVTDHTPLSRGYERLRDPAMHRIGVGTTHDMRSVVTGVFVESLRSSSYSPVEKLNLWRGRRYSRGFGLWDQLLATDVTRQVSALPIPAYFLHGRHDRTVSYRLAESYAGNLRAPLVGFYTFESSAHSPVFEEPDRALRILTDDVLNGTTALADPRGVDRDVSRRGPASH